MKVKEEEDDDEGRKIYSKWQGENVWSYNGMRGRRWRRSLVFFSQNTTYDVVVVERSRTSRNKGEVSMLVFGCCFPFATMPLVAAVSGNVLKDVFVDASEFLLISDALCRRPFWHSALLSLRRVRHWNFSTSIYFGLFYTILHWEDTRMVFPTV